MHAFRDRSKASQSEWSANASMRLSRRYAVGFTVSCEPARFTAIQSSATRKTPLSRVEFTERRNATRRSSSKMSAGEKVQPRAEVEEPNPPAPFPKREGGVVSLSPPFLGRVLNKSVVEGGFSVQNAQLSPASEVRHVESHPTRAVVRTRSTRFRPTRSSRTLPPPSATPRRFRTVPPPSGRGLPPHQRPTRHRSHSHAQDPSSASTTGFPIARSWPAPKPTWPFVGSSTSV